MSSVHILEQNTLTLAVEGLPMSTSGAAYRKVPCALEAEEKQSVMVASPTSATFAAPPLVSRMLLVLTSLHHRTQTNRFTNHETFLAASFAVSRSSARLVTGRPSMTVNHRWARQTGWMGCDALDATYIEGAQPESSLGFWSEIIVDAYLWTTPFWCRKCRPCATDSATSWPRFHQSNSRVPPSASRPNAFRKSPP